MSETQSPYLETLKDIERNYQMKLADIRKDRFEKMIDLHKLAQDNAPPYIVPPDIYEQIPEAERELFRPGTSEELETLAQFVTLMSGAKSEQTKDGWIHTFSSPSP